MQTARGIAYTVKRADEVNMDTLADLMNDAYSDYYVPTHVTPERLVGLVCRDDVSLARSFVAFSGSVPVGTVLLGVRGRRGYVCGMGVKRSHQGRGIGHMLMNRVVMEARAYGLTDLRLEVVRENERAAALYSSFGFRPFRELGMFMRVRKPYGKRRIPPGLEIEKVNGGDAIHLMPEFYECPPCWQNEDAAFQRISDKLSAIIGTLSGREVGYVLYRDAPTGLFIADVASLNTSDRTEIATALLSFVDEESVSENARAFNIPTAGYQEAALRSRGYELRLVQVEMILELEQGDSETTGVSACSELH